MAIQHVEDILKGNCQNEKCDKIKKYQEKSLYELQIIIFLAAVKYSCTLFTVNK